MEENIDELLQSMGQPDPPLQEVPHLVIQNIVLWLDFQSLVSLINALLYNKDLWLVLSRTLNYAQSWRWKCVNLSYRKRLLPHFNKITSIKIDSNLSRSSVDLFFSSDIYHLPLLDELILENNPHIKYITSLIELQRLTSLMVINCVNLDFVSLRVVANKSHSLSEVRVLYQNAEKNARSFHSLVCW